MLWFRTNDTDLRVSFVSDARWRLFGIVDMRAELKDEFLVDTQCQDAAIRRLEIVGVVACSISGEARATQRSLPLKTLVRFKIQIR